MIHGSCLCKSISFGLAGELQSARYRHSDNCRTFSGTSPAVWAIAKAAGLVLHRLAMVVIAVMLSGCVAHKVTATDQFRQSSLANVAGPSDVHVTRIDSGHEGWQCFEPMLYVLTLGIIPAHCLERYHMSLEEPPSDAVSELPTHVEVSSVQGWVTLFLAMSPRWKFGYIDDAEAEIPGIVMRADGQGE